MYDNNIYAGSTIYSLVLPNHMAFGAANHSKVIGYFVVLGPNKPLVLILILMNLWLAYETPLCKYVSTINRPRFNKKKKKKKNI